VKVGRNTIFLIFPAAVALLLGGAYNAGAFHSGGVGECDGCHTMHNSENGVSLGPVGPSLLKGGDASSNCLHCHEQPRDAGPTTYHISTPGAEMPQGVPPKQLTPGGDFGWLKKSYSWIPADTQPITMLTSDGDRHGHNIVAGDYGYLPDNTRVVAPGGSYPAASLSCISCHDPHGKYRRNQDGSVSVGGKPIRSSGSFETSPAPDGKTSVGVYRMLGGSGYLPRNISSGFAFISWPPAAVAPLKANRAEDVSYTRVAYGAGMSEWCKNCHTNIHNGLYSFNHPAPGALGAPITDYYNRYMKKGDLSGAQATSYLSLVPFEVGTYNYQTLISIVTNTPTQGPNPSQGTSAVTCLSCHRAHASGWDSMMRWNSKSDYIEYNGRYSQEGQTYQPYGQGRSEAEALQAYDQIPASRFDPAQDSFCYKCHATIPAP
jgi:hypothetical protein